jgi:AcrR family transcriptional regulator
MAPDPPKLDPRIRRTRQMLFDAFRALLAEKTFDAITVQDIAERSTLNRATFYDHFPDKFALLEAMIAERFRAVISVRLEGTDRTCEEAVRLLILAACDFLAEVTSGCQKNQRQFEPTVESQMKSVMREILLAALIDHEIECAELKATMVSWAIAGASLQWSRQRKISAEKLAAVVLQIAVAALRS